MIIKLIKAVMNLVTNLTKNYITKEQEIHKKINNFESDRDRKIAECQ